MYFNLNESNSASSHTELLYRVHEMSDSHSPGCIVILHHGSMLNRMKPRMNAMRFLEDFSRECGKAVLPQVPARACLREFPLRRRGGIFIRPPARSREHPFFDYVNAIKEAKWKMWHIYILPII